jgi:outer membrane protein, heavy metal efflux system
MKSIKYFLMIFILLYSIPVDAQSLDSLIQEGLRNNPGLKSGERNITAAELRSRSFGYLPPPTIGVEFSQVPFSDADPLKNSLSQNLIISQMFMTGGKLSAMEEAERKRAEVVRTDLDSYRLSLIEEISKTYFDVWMMEHHIELREHNLSLLNNISSSTEQFYKVSRASYSDMVLIKAEIAANKAEIEVMENELQSMYYMLNSLLGRDDKNAEIIVKHNWEPDTSAIDNDLLEESLISENPSLQKMRRMEEMNRLEITANKKELYPDLMLQGMVMRMPRGMILTSASPVHLLDGMGETEYMYSIMASVTLPFVPWASGKNRYKEEELLASIEGISSERNNMELMIRSKFYSLLNSLKSKRREMLLLNNEVLPLYRQALESQLSEFQNNRNTIVNIIQTINMLLMKEEELAEVQTSHQKILAEIKNLTAAEGSIFKQEVQ